MKNTRTKIIPVLLCAVMALCLARPAFAAYSGETLYSNKTRIADGLEYENTFFSTSSGKQESFILTLKPGRDVYAIASDGGEIRGGCTINAAVKSAEEQGYNTLAAINADFFTMSTGVPTGIYIENGSLVSTDDGQNAIGFYSDGSAFIGKPGISLNMKNTTKGTDIKVDHLNKAPSPYTFNLLNSDYDSSFTLSGNWTIAVLEVLSKDFTPDGSAEYRVSDIVRQDGGRYYIPDGCMVLAAKTDGDAAARFDGLETGDRLSLDISNSDSRFENAVWAVGCGDVLISGGEITPSSSWDSAISGRNPRTALGIKDTGEVVFYVGDGRQSGYSAGLTLSQLAGEMKALGCAWAVNLDGGGSSAMSLRCAGDTSASVINSTSGALRSCGTFLLLVTDCASNGKAENLFLESDGALVLPNSKIDIGKILATDSGYRTVPAPSDSRASVSSALGEIQGTTFYSGGSAGAADISLSASGASGSAEIFITDSITGVSVTSGGKTVSSLKLYEGDSVSVSGSALYYDRIVASEAENFTYSVPAGTGTVSASGKITAGALSCGTGQVTVSCGGIDKTIPVYILPKFHDIENHWSKSYVEKMGENGITYGIVTSGLRYFSPDSNITREEFFTLMARAMGVDTSKYESTALPFADTGEISDWALPSIKALYSEGILSGGSVGGQLYASPKSTITRQEAFTLISRLSGNTYPEEEISAALSAFEDSGEIAGWARSGIYDMISRKIVSGYGDGTINPLGNLTRGETAKIIMSAV